MSDDAGSAVRDAPADAERPAPSAMRVVGELLLLLAAGAVWTALTGASLTFDATPVPGDGTVFGELAGLVAAMIGWRIVMLVARLRTRVR